MEEETKIKADIEESRMRYTIAGSNPQLYSALFKEESEEEKVEKDIEWLTPEDPEDIEAIIETLSLTVQE